MTINKKVKNKKVIPKTYKKDGKRYIKVKGKKVYLANNLSERQLIKVHCV
jgi:hypothetical protein